MSNKADRTDNAFRQSYFSLLQGRFRLLTVADKNVPAFTEADAISNKCADDVTWEDIYRLELAILKLEPIDDLRRHAWAIRQEYRGVASATDFAEYEKNAPDPKEAKESELRADLSRVQ